MIAIYYLTRFLLMILHAFVKGRAASWQKHYEKLSVQLQDQEKLFCSVGDKPTVAQWTILATQGPEMARLSHKRERAETKHNNWQSRAESIASGREAIAVYKGKFGPYLLGKADALILSMVADSFGYGPGHFASFVARGAYKLYCASTGAGTGEEI